MEEGCRAFKMLTGVPKEKKPLGRPRRRGGNIVGIGLIRLRIWFIGEPL